MQQGKAYGLVELSKMADEVRTVDDLSKFLFAVIEDGRSVPTPRYWQWKLDDMFMENVAAEIAGHQHHRPILNLQAAMHGRVSRGEPVGEPTTAEGALKYVANAIVAAIVKE